MATVEKLSGELASEIPRGTVSACTPADRAALTDFYRAVFPHATAANLAADIRDEEAAAWITYRDDQGEIRVAMLLRADGFVWLLARPEECESAEVLHGFLRLVEEARAALVPYGIQSLTVLHSVSLQPLARHLEKDGVLGKEMHILRTLHFSPSGGVMRYH